MVLPTRASHCQYENSDTLAPLNFHALNETLALGIPRYTCSQLVRTALFWENYILGKLYTNTFLTVSNRVSSSVAAVGTLTFIVPPSRSSVVILRDLTRNSHHYLRNAPSTQEIAHKDQYTSHLQNKSAQKFDHSNSILVDSCHLVHAHITPCTISTWYIHDCLLLYTMAQISYCMAARASPQILALRDVKARVPNALTSHSANICRVVLTTIQSLILVVILALTTKSQQWILRYSPQYLKLFALLQGCRKSWTPLLSNAVTAKAVERNKTLSH